jgi:pimeloyl-ACP methyl ester carboxylesterase
MTTWTANDGTQINFEIYGGRANGDVLLLLHGLLGSIASQWGSFVKSLSTDFRVILMDLRGHGRSTNAEDSLEPMRMTQDIADLLDHLGAATVSVAGFDLGGYLGLMLALNEPNRVSSLLMHGTKFYWTAEAAAQMREQLDPDRMAEKVPAYADQLVQEHGGRHWRVLVRHAADLVTNLAQQGMTEGIVSRTLCPVIVSVGDRDEIVLLQEAQRLSRILPEGKLLVLPGVRHSFQTVRLIPLLPMMQFFHKTANR